MVRPQTVDITIAYKGRELMLEVVAYKPEPMTRDYPGCDAEFEIIKAQWRDGEELSPDELVHVHATEQDQVFDQLERLDEYTREDYLLEKAEDAVYEAKWADTEARYLRRRRQG